MLTERKCVMCKHFIFDFTFEHKCKAYPKGIPDEIFKEDTSHPDCNPDCKSRDYHFEQDKKRP